MNRTVLRAVAVVLVVVGAMAVASPQFAYSSVTTDRSGNIDVVADSNAYLGIFDNSQNVGRVDSDPQEVFYLDDNAGVFTADNVNATVVSYANCTNASTDDCPSVSVGVTTAGYDFAATVSCDGTNIKATDTMTLELRATSSELDVVAQRTTTAAVETNCAGNTGSSGAFDFVNASNVTSGGTQTFSFQPNGTMKNGDTVTIDLSSVEGVDYSSAFVSSVTGNNQAQFVDSTTIEFTSQGSTSGTVDIVVDGYAVTGNVGDTETAYFSRNGKTDSDDFEIV